MLTSLPGRPFNSTKIVGPTQAALAARLTLHVLEARRQLQIRCPSTLAREVWPFWPRSTRSPVLRISDSAILVKDGEGGLLAGLSRPGQISLQPDDKSSAMLTATSFPWARARAERGAGSQWGNPGRRPGTGGLTSKPAPCCHCILRTALAPLAQG